MAKVKGFWTEERCEYCGDRLVDKRVEVSRKSRGKYVLLQNVPAGVCLGCGTRYYAANVLKTIDETIRGRRKADRQILVPVYSFS